MNDKLLRIYLQDHLAGSTGGARARPPRARRTRAPTYGDALAKLADEIEADRRALESIMDDLGFGADRAKNLAFWAAEKAGRLKPNGQLTGYSPLSRMVEIEGLLTGVNGKLSLWRALLEIAADEPRLDADRLSACVERAESSWRRRGAARARRARGVPADAPA